VTEYTRSTGSSGTMLISDNAPGASSGTIEFWINSNNGTTFDHELPWAATIDGSFQGWQEFDYNAGAGWQQLGVWNITYSQNVTFHLGATGTSGFGGPTNFTQWIQRATVPDPPSNPSFTNVKPTTIDVNWTPNGNGGASIDNYEVGYALTNTAPTSFVTSTTSPKTVTGLTPGTNYYFWVRAHNSVGWGAYSGPVLQQTIAGVRYKDGATWKIAVPYVRHAGVWKLARPYVKTLGVWKETI